MFTTLTETQRAGLTIFVFFLTFFVTLSIGRILKRRAGVRLGLLFQLFCITAAFYAAIWTYGLPLQFRHHITALLILMSTVIVVALINRYLWDYYFEKKKQTPIPHFLREMVALVVFLFALLLVLSLVYHAEAQLKGLLAGSGIIAIILGFAGQNLFGGIIAGISLQISRPYKVGDWLQVGERYAEVMEINWRSTRLRTNDAIYLDIPNNEIVRQTIINLHYPTQVHAMRIRVGIDYKHPPNRVKDALMRATKNAELVLREPPPRIFLVDFADHAVTYEIKFYMGNHAAINEVNDAIRTNIWYELKRQRISIPFPTRTLQLERRSKDAVPEEREKARTILREDPIFQCLEEEQLDSLIIRSQLNRFGRGERVIEEGAAGDSMFVLLRGTANVSVARNGAPLLVGILRAGDLFGEMSLLTGEPRTATVRAEHDCEVLEISKAVMSEVLHAAPQCLDQLSELLAKRKMETEGIVREATPTAEQTSKEREYRDTFLRRLRTFFEL
ncbi:MAG TPA: mechanosensitive ion channel family protein [Candidatus Udaeobacter sp.]|jgi:small-conductance mechanosensitive channel/CRP-like cAMP-binding protein|nr:mechanosensitive ion channel family protein [Candidatus Udaeobacter sp.]